MLNNIWVIQITKIKTMGNQTGQNTWFIQLIFQGQKISMSRLCQPNTIYKSCLDLDLNKEN